MQKKSLNIGLSISIVILIMVAFFCQTSPVGGASLVSTDKDIYNYGETIKVIFSNSPGNDTDWICIVPIGFPDTEAGDYKQLPKGLTQGFLTFNPPASGKYEARAYYDYDRKGYVVSGRCTFSVISSPEYERELLLKAESLARKINPDNPLEADLTADNGLIYIFRETWNMAENIAVQIKANGKPIVTLKNADYFLFSVPAGKVNFTTKHFFNGEVISARSGEATIDVKSGYVYYLRLKIFPVGFSSSLESIPHQEGAGLINSYKLTRVK